MADDRDVEARPPADDDRIRAALRTALFDTSLTGIGATGEVYPLGGFLLAGAMVDMLAGLVHAPANDMDGKQGTRYASFVNRFFPPAYEANGIGEKMWFGMRCRPLHNFSAGELLLADSQPGKGLHLRPEPDGRVWLHWPEFLDDYRSALDAYWQGLTNDSELMAAARRRCERYPPLMVTEVWKGGVTFPITFPATFGSGASAYGSSPSS
jgi:hypothetical protein